MFTNKYYVEVLNNKIIAVINNAKKNKPVPQLKVLAVLIYVLACFALDVATQANFLIGLRLFAPSFNRSARPLARHSFIQSQKT